MPSSPPPRPAPAPFPGAAAPATCVDCDASPPRVRGLCQRCYNARRNGGLPLPPTRREASATPRCQRCLERDASDRGDGLCGPCLVDLTTPRTARREVA